MSTKLIKNVAAEITKLHNQIHGEFKTSLEHAITIGELLTEQKGRMDHGEFIPWIDKYLPFKRQAAANYMRAYKHRELLLERANSVTDAYRLLTMPKVKTDPKCISRNTFETKSDENFSKTPNREDDSNQAPSKPIKPKVKTDPKCISKNTFKIKSDENFSKTSTREDDSNQAPSKPIKPKVKTDPKCISKNTFKIKSDENFSKTSTREGVAPTRVADDSDLDLVSEIDSHVKPPTSPVAASDPDTASKEVEANHEPTEAEVDAAFDLVTDYFESVDGPKIREWFYDNLPESKPTVEELRAELLALDPNAFKSKLTVEELRAELLALDPDAFKPLDLESCIKAKTKGMTPKDARQWFFKVVPGTAPHTDDFVATLIASPAEALKVAKQLTASQKGIVLILGDPETTVRDLAKVIRKSIVNVDKTKAKNLWKTLSAEIDSEIPDEDYFSNM